MLLIALSQQAVSAEGLPATQELLNRLVQINSHSKNPAGIQAVRNLVIPEFEKLGFTASQLSLAENHVLTTLDFPDENPKVLLIGHLDTVFPSSAQVGKVGTVGDRVYGPGIIDMKGGIVVMIKTLESLSLDERKRVRIVLNDDEELASVFSRNQLREVAQGIPFGLVFEPGLPDGSLVTSSSGGRWIKLAIRGKAAHAGMEHEKGLNACTELAHHLVELHAMTDYSKKLTLNVGVIEGGTQPNVVCEQASATLDIRYVEPKDLEEMLRKIEENSKQFHLRNGLLGLSPTSHLETIAVVPSMPETATQTLFGMVQEVGKIHGQTLHGQHVGYATDGNHLVQTGMQLLVGLGPFGGGMHTDQEFLKQGSVEERILLSSRLIREILKRESLHAVTPIELKEISATVTSFPSESVNVTARRYQVRSFNEVMFPSLGNNNRFVPKPGGLSFVPAFFAGQVRLDAEIAPHYRVFYLQKGLAIYPQQEGAEPTGRLLDPRLGLRRTEVFSVPNLTTGFDLFVQPGLAQAFIRQPNRILDLGMRLENRYEFPASNWNIGGNFEFVTTFFNQPTEAADISGTLALYSSYRISRLFATQHWITSFYKHQSGDPLLKFSWDITGMPYFQNGISVTPTKECALSLLLNHYAFELPSLPSMWISLWTSIKFG
jgi:glutamate carboxypeptidase